MYIGLTDKYHESPAGIHISMHVRGATEADVHVTSGGFGVCVKLFGIEYYFDTREQAIDAFREALHGIWRTS